MSAVNELCDRELKLIEEYRLSENARLDKKRGWLVFQLESWARSTGEKTIRLIHGQCKLRKGRDKVVITSLDEFLPEAQTLGLLKRVPESYNPDLAAVLQHVKATGEVLPGTEVIPAEVKFTYSIKGVTSNGKRGTDETQSGDCAE
jgi:hypothetical protein